MEFKDLAWCTSFEARDVLCQAEATLPSEKLHWTLVAYRALRDLRVCDLERAVARWFPLQARFVALGPGQELMDVYGAMIRNLSLHIVDDDIAALDASRQEHLARLEDERAEHARQALIRARARREGWLRCRRRLVLASVRRVDGTAAESDDESGELLHSHWSAVAASIPFSLGRLGCLRTFATRPPQDFEYKMSFEDFRERLDSRRFCAPGDDGIPYAVWQAGGLRAAGVL